VTKRQADTYQFIKAFVAANGYSPSFDDIRRHLGLVSKCSPHRIVMGLVRQGYVSHQPGYARTLEIIK
jgi:repressor LexA